MTTLRAFRADDLFRFNHINLDPLTETYNIPFYLSYLCTWPSLCAALEDPNGRLMGYILGKAEGKKHLWHGHVTAVTVAPEYRRIGCAKTLMQFLEKGTEEAYNGYFVDLFVRESNTLAQTMYKNLGYTIYRRVLGYYSGEEDAFGRISSLYFFRADACLVDMRKAMPRDVKRKSIVPLNRPIKPEELEW